MSELTRKLIYNRGKQNIFTLIMTAVVMLALSGLAGATPIPGAFPMWNGGTSVAITPPCINLFLTTAGVCPPNVPSNFVLANPSDAIFGTVPTTQGTTNDYLAANQASFAPGNQAYSGGVAFMTLNGFTFDVTTITVPSGTMCTSGTSTSAGTICVIEDLTLTQIDTGTVNPALCPGGVLPCGTVTAAFHSNGIGYSGSSTTGSTPFTYSYTSQFNNETIPDLLAKANAGPVEDSVSITANGINAVPEPMAFSLVGLGLAALGVAGRFLRARS
jgi:hypothetical protein